jgi:hypothetical protein
MNTAKRVAQRFLDHKTARGTVKVNKGKSGYWIVDGLERFGPFTAQEAVEELEDLLKPGVVILGPRYSLGRHQTAVSSKTPYALLDLRGDVVDQGSLKALWKKHYDKLVGRITEDLHIEVLTKKDYRKLSGWALREWGGYHYELYYEGIDDPSIEGRKDHSRPISSLEELVSIRDIKKTNWYDSNNNLLQGHFYIKDGLVQATLIVKRKDREPLSKEESEYLADKLNAKDY